MKKLLVLFLITNINLAWAQTQRTMNQGVCQTNSDKELNKVYQDVLKKKASNKEFITAIKKAQRAWIVFRDSHLESIFPGTVNKRVQYGSVYPMCNCSAEDKLIRDRIIQLQKWLGTKEEGDVCLGTRMR